MKNSLTLFLCIASLLLFSAVSNPAPPPYGGLHIINIPAEASDLGVSFFQPGATTINVLGSQLGYTKGAGTIYISAANAAQHFGNNGFNAQGEFHTKISLLDETGDAIAEPVIVDFFLNPNGDTELSYSGL
jgi:hypothetical protein